MKTAILGVAGLLLAVSTASADVQLTMHDGRVSLVAKDATVRQILTEWARVGQTRIVNVERIPGGPVSLELSNVPEAQALEILLRTLSGYITAPRPIDAANLSRYDRIIIMPTLASARPVVSSAPPPAQAAFVQPGAPQFNVTPTPEDDSDDERPAAPVPLPPGQRGPVFNTFPQPQVVTPQNGQQPGGAPQAAPAAPIASPTPVAPYGGVSVPGMVAPPPPVPAGQQQPGAVPVRRPGGPGEQR